MRNIPVFIVLALVLSACTLPLAAPTPTLVPSPLPVVPSDTPGPTDTPAPTATFTATATEIQLATATFSGSETPLASTGTATVASVIPSPTVFLFYLASPTPPGGVPAFDCDLIAQTSTSGVMFDPGERFTINWKIKNTGSAGWFPGAVDFVYVAGTRMGLDTEVQLTGTVSPGSTVGLSAEMKAPLHPSTYTAYWSLRSGKDYFCHVKVTIAVRKP